MSQGFFPHTANCEKNFIQRFKAGVALYFQNWFIMPIEQDCWAQDLTNSFIMPIREKIQDAYLNRIIGGISL
jgi:hypothetical protein